MSDDLYNIIRQIVRSSEKLFINTKNKMSDDFFKMSDDPVKSSDMSDDPQKLFVNTASGQD